MKSRAAQMNQLMVNILMLLFIVHYQEVQILNCLINKETNKKVLINIKNDDVKCFLWCHVRHLNPLETHPERITKVDKNGQ